MFFFFISPFSWVRKTTYDGVQTILQTALTETANLGELSTLTICASVGFQVVPKRWIVESSFAWLENFRRLVIYYEFHAKTAVAMIQLAFCFLTLNKLF